MTNARPAPPRLGDFGFHSTDKLRYGDTDGIGHVNNANYATFYETGRIEILRRPGLPPAPAGAMFVLVHVTIDFLREITWPGTVTTGTGIVSVGRSSCHFRQAIFQDGECMSTSGSVTVLMDLRTRRSVAIDEAWRAVLEGEGSALHPQRGSPL